MKLVAGQGVAQDQLEEVARVDTFDSYVKPIVTYGTRDASTYTRYILMTNVLLVPTRSTMSGGNSRPG
jgi:hypothetical protein